MKKYKFTEETKDGQTHSFNDGCGEPAHNSEKIEKEYTAEEAREYIFWFQLRFRKLIDS